MSLPCSHCCYLLAHIMGLEKRFRIQARYSPCPTYVAKILFKSTSLIKPRGCKPQNCFQSPSKMNNFQQMTVEEGPKTLHASLSCMVPTAQRRGWFQVRWDVDWPLFIPLSNPPLFISSVTSIHTSVSCNEYVFYCASNLLI